MSSDESRGEVGDKSKKTMTDEEAKAVSVCLS